MWVNKTPKFIHLRLFVICYDSGIVSNLVVGLLAGKMRKRPSRVASQQTCRRHKFYNVSHINNISTPDTRHVRLSPQIPYVNPREKWFVGPPPDPLPPPPLEIIIFFNLVVKDTRYVEMLEID
jgi:hypothetical protein